MSHFEKVKKSTNTALSKIIKDLEQEGIRNVHVHAPDLNGLLRTKIVPLHCLKSGLTINSSIYALSHSDGYPIGDIVYESPHIWFHTGFGNIFAYPDKDTLCPLPWVANSAEVILNTFHREGDRYCLDLRQPLEALEQKLKAKRLVLKVGFEFEFGIFHYDRELLEQGRHNELKPFGQSQMYSSLSRDPEYMALMAELQKRLNTLGIGIASMETESGKGMYEVALEPETPLKAADNAVLFRHHLKLLCREKGLIATFMARYQPIGQDAACGTHIHLSLYDKTGNNLFKHDEKVLSAKGEQFLSGLLHRIKESHLAFRPTINSYRRLTKMTGCPEEICWGNENRLVAVRLAHSPNPNNIRFEHRCSGADINAYIALTLIAAAGLDGLENKYDLPPLVESNPDDVKGLEKLPRTLKESIELFKESDFVKNTLGKELAEQYWLSRENELSAFQAWIDKEITTFEFQRYFEGV
ncbi:glutamine synthetase [Shewanella sp. OPT22]|nr:glutamine synthetase [Shewanella sp. OPT22]